VVAAAALAATAGSWAGSAASVDARAALVATAASWAVVRVAAWQAAQSGPANAAAEGC
jgi:hypothetical protein